MPGRARIWPALILLAGSSLGALISALLYFRMPERVKKIILINCGSLLGDWDPRLKEGIMRSRANGRAAFVDPTPEVCRQRMANICFDVASIPESVILMQMNCHALPGALEARGSGEPPAITTRARPPASP